MEVLCFQVHPSNGSITGGTVITVEGRSFTWSDTSDDGGRSVSTAVTIDGATCTVKSIEFDR